MLEKFGADVNNTLLAKGKRQARYNRVSFKTRNQKIEHI